jgi:hypothetical protein
MPAPSSPKEAEEIGSLNDAPSRWKMASALDSESLRGYRNCGFILLAFFALIVGISTALGAAPITGPWDVAILLDGGWRIVNAQAPHTDFHNPIGPLAYMLVAFGMKIHSPSTAAITYGTDLLFVIVMPCAWYVASRRFPWALASFFVLFTGFYLITPRPPGYAIFDTTYAMMYNREAYVLISILLVSVLVKPRATAASSEWSEGIIVGLLFGLLFYCKITYFVFAIPLTLLGVLLEKRPLRWFIAAGAGLVVVIAVFFALHIRPSRYIADIAAAGRSQSPGMRITLLSQSIVDNGVWIYLLIVCLVILTCAAAKQAPARNLFAGFRLWAVALSTLGAALLISSGNGSQGGGVDDPLYFVAALMLLEIFRRKHAQPNSDGANPARIAYGACALLLLPIFGGVILARDAASCGYSLAWQFFRRPAFASARRIHSADLSDFYVPPSTTHMTAYWAARDYPDDINDGIALLQRSMQKGDRLTTIALTNPFNFALSLQPAHDADLWWDLNFSFDRKHFPPPSAALGDATLVIVPRLIKRNAGCCFATVDAMLDIYGDYLRANFHPVGSTDIWVLYRRN